MKFLLITKDKGMAEMAREGFHPSDELNVYEDWQDALNHTDGVDLIFVEMLATLNEPHKVEGYEQFAMAKMKHATAKEVPLVLIAPPPDYELDFMVGWPDFILAQMQSPVTAKLFRRASTWV